MADASLIQERREQDEMPAQTTDGQLTPMQAAVVQVLACRWRLGEQFWTFEGAFRPALEQLSRKGLVSYQSGVTERSWQARLTEAGQDTALRAGFNTPKLVQALEWGFRDADGRDCWCAGEEAARTAAVSGQQLIVRYVLRGKPSVVPNFVQPGELG